MIQQKRIFKDFINDNKIKLLVRTENKKEQNPMVFALSKCSRGF